MSSTVTVTGVIGPAQAVTAQVFQNVTSFDIDCTNQLVKINQGTNPTTIISITGKSTLTLTQVNNNYTLSIS